MEIDAAALSAAELSLSSELLKVIEELALVVRSLEWVLGQLEEFLHFRVDRLRLLINYSIRKL